MEKWGIDIMKRKLRQEEVMEVPERRMIWKISGYYVFCFVACHQRPWWLSRDACPRSCVKKVKA